MLKRSHFEQVTSMSLAFKEYMTALRGEDEQERAYKRGDRLAEEPAQYEHQRGFQATPEPRRRNPR